MELRCSNGREGFSLDKTDLKLMKITKIMNSVSVPNQSSRQNPETVGKTHDAIISSQRKIKHNLALFNSNLII